jgi:hypothetical protein
MGSHRDRLSCVRGAGVRWATGLLIALGLAGPAMAADCPAGRFRAAAGPDPASGLEIREDGHFRYFLSVGAVDEEAEGVWTCDKGTLRLTTQPAPKPAAFRLDKVTDGEDAPFALVVTWPNGQGVPAVDFRIDFSSGEPVTGYTQQDGWDRDLGDRWPTAVQFAEPFYGTVSEPLPIPQRRGIRLHVVLEPNDMGKAAFRDTPVTQEDGKLMLHWRGGKLPYARDEEGE